MLSTGIDIVEIPRFEKALSRWGERFLERVYTANELTICQGRVPELAARFAAKEAVMKALGTGMRGVGWR
jgi:holo-[acyl-carrier protein] synthase